MPPSKRALQQLWNQAASRYISMTTFSEFCDQAGDAILTSTLKVILERQEQITNQLAEEGKNFLSSEQVAYVYKGCLGSGETYRRPRTYQK